MRYVMTITDNEELLKEYKMMSYKGRSIEVSKSAKDKMWFWKEGSVWTGMPFDEEGRIYTIKTMVPAND